MNRRTLIIIIAAALFALVVGLVWFFFFRATVKPAATTGTFGTGQLKPGSSTGTGTNANNSSSGTLPTGSNTNVGTGIQSSGGGTGGAGGAAGGAGGIANIPGVDWLGGGGGGTGGGGGGPTTNFVPKTINDLNNNNVSGTPYIFSGGGGPGDDNGGGLGLGTALLGAGIAGAVSCTASLFGSALLGGGIGGTLIVGNTLVAVPVNDIALNAQTAYGNTLKTNDTVRDNFLNCIARGIARAAIQQITASVVNWINSGFNGQPSFVRNYQQFFTNVADQAAGEFIRGSSLSFLCSPFQLQIRVAIAQSYARQGAMSCSLTSIIKNVTGFMNGNFSQGGWGGLLQFTSIPTNNPFGAFAYAQVGLTNAQNQAVGQRQQDYILGRGFISSTKEVNCTVTSGPPAGGTRPGQKTTAIEGGQYRTCNTVVTTPGSTIAESLNKTLGVSQDSLNLAKSFDEIISALITQLMTRTLQGGLSELSGQSGYASNFLTPAQQQAQADAQALLTDMQGKVQIAQQYGSTQQGSIADIQSAQSQLQSLANCWEAASSSPSLSEDKQKIAQTHAFNAVFALHQYDPKIDAYNANITRANTGIAVLQDLQTKALSVASAADVAAVTAAYKSALASGTIITEADVTNATQDRTTLQSALASRNQQTADELQQCNAFK